MKEFIIENYNSKIKKSEYFLVLLLILFSSNSNPIFRDEPVRYSIIPIIIAFFFYAKNFIVNRGVKLGKNSSSVYIVLILYIIAYLIKYSGDFDPGFSYRIFKYITLSFLIVQVVGYKFFKVYENIIFVLALISIPLFLLEATVYNLLFSVMNIIQSILHIPKLVQKEYVNILIFTINRGSEVGNLRNCGFAWEPGGYANFLILAIIINLAANKFNLKNKRFIVLLVALLTTFSTTGFLALFFLTIWYLANVNFVKTLLLMPAVVLVFTYISTLPFMSEKIFGYYENASKDLRTTIFLAKATGASYSLGRFAGMLMTWKDYKEHPIIGYGGHGELTFSSKWKIEVYSVNGLGKWAAQFGTIGLLLFIFTWLKSLSNLSVLYDFKKPAVIFGAILVLAFSFNLIQSGLFFAFQLSFLYLPAYETKLIEKDEYEVDELSIE